MTTPTTNGPRVGMATRRGTRAVNMDAAHVYTASDGTLAAAVVDGIGNFKSGPAVLNAVAFAIARIAATRGAVAGILAGAALLADPGVGEEDTPGAVAVAAVLRPGDIDGVDIALVGDCQAYGYDGTTFTRYTTPQTMGEFLRFNGDTDRALEHDNWVQVTLCTATPMSVARSCIPAGQLVVLTSDGLDDVFLGDLKAVMGGDVEPQQLAEKLVAMADENGAGYRDDATVVVIAP